MSSCYAFLINSSPAQKLYHQEQTVSQGVLHYSHIPSHHIQYKFCWLLLGSHILIYNSNTWDDSVDTAAVSPYGICDLLQSTETMYHIKALNVPQHTRDKITMGQALVPGNPCCKIKCYSNVWVSQTWQTSSPSSCSSLSCTVLWSPSSSSGPLISSSFILFSPNSDGYICRHTVSFQKVLYHCSYKLYNSMHITIATVHRLQVSWKVM